MTFNLANMQQFAVSVVGALIAARKRDGAIIWGFGAHVVKTGLSPILIELMERGCVPFKPRPKTFDSIVQADRLHSSP